MPAVPTDAPPKATRVTPGRVAVTVIVLGITMLWIYALTRQPQPPPDQLDDPAFAQQAEQTCRATVARLDQLPAAHEASTPTERAAIVERSNAELATMLATLGAAAPAGGRDGVMLDEWLGDWAVYVENRNDYVARLRTDGDTRIYVAEKDGRQITVAVDRFAEVNDMPTCRTPKDIS